MALAGIEAMVLRAGKSKKKESLERPVVFKWFAPAKQDQSCNDNSSLQYEGEVAWHAACAVPVRCHVDVTHL